MMFEEFGLDDVIGFSPGSESHSKVTSLQSIQNVNLFRIDGKVNYSRIIVDGSMNVFLCTSGLCITSAAPGHVCGLNAVTTQCKNLTATMCSCNQGFQTVDGLVCEGKDLIKVWVLRHVIIIADINECSLGQPAYDCDQVCENTEGGYNCACEAGYRLLNDSRTCEGSLYGC